jgi:FMN-dependent oxidoreductase (nitrilotriacetate monooxygenase family)
MMTLGANLNAMGSHLGEWCHPAFWSPACMNLDNAIGYAQLAERGKFDFVFLADGNGVRQMDKPALFAASAPATRPAVFEPVTLLSAIAMSTRRIGLVATATTTYEEPYTLARKFASLDHLSRGRAGWNLVTTADETDALNFGRAEHVARDLRYDRAREFADVVRGLWDSWAEDAFVQDVAAGRYLDPARVHRLDHKGPHLSVRGPLNIARPPQGHPVVFSAGQSDRGKELSAYAADCVFGIAASMAEAAATYADFKSRMAKYGRAPEAMRILPGVTIIIEDTPGEADALLAALDDLVPIAVGLDYLARQLGRSLEGFDLDGPVPPPLADQLGGSATRHSVYAMASREGLTIRQAYKRVIGQMAGLIFKGSATAVADQMEAWYRAKACDGFVVTAPVVPTGLARIIDRLIPELQRRGLFKPEYEHALFRTNLGLPVPANRFFPDQAAPSPGSGWRRRLSRRGPAAARRARRR